MDTKEYYSYILSISQGDLSTKIDIENDFYLSLDKNYALNSVKVDELGTTGDTTTNYVTFTYNF